MQQKQQQQQNQNKTKIQATSGFFTGIFTLAEFTK